MIATHLIISLFPGRVQIVLSQYLNFMIQEFTSNTAQRLRMNSEPTLNQAKPIATHHLYGERIPSFPKSSDLMPIIDWRIFSYAHDAGLLHTYVSCLAEFQRRLRSIQERRLNEVSPKLFTATFSFRTHNSALQRICKSNTAMILIKYSKPVFLSYPTVVVESLEPIVHARTEGQAGQRTPYATKEPKNRRRKE